MNMYVHALTFVRVLMGISYLIGSSS